MKNIFILQLLILLLLIGASCSDQHETLEDKLGNLKLATREDLVRLGELELNSSNVPAYNAEGERLNDRQMLEILESKNYKIDYYLDENERLGAVVIQPDTTDARQTTDL